MTKSSNSRGVVFNVFYYSSGSATISSTNNDCILIGIVLGTSFEHLCAIGNVRTGTPIASRLSNATYRLWTKVARYLGAKR